MLHPQEVILVQVGTATGKLIPTVEAIRLDREAQKLGSAHAYAFNAQMVRQIEHLRKAGAQ